MCRPFAAWGGAAASAEVLRGVVDLAVGIEPAWAEVGFDQGLPHLSTCVCCAGAATTEPDCRTIAAGRADRKHVGRLARALLELALHASRDQCNSMCVSSRASVLG